MCCVGLSRPAGSRQFQLVRALTAVQGLTYEELQAQYTFEAGQVWTAGKKRIMIRDHYPALFRSMCKNANVHTIGDQTEVANGGHALLRGTAGTGKSSFMFVMFIEFLKMLRASPAEELVAVDGVVVFNPAVSSIVIQWDGICGGNEVLFDNGSDDDDDVWAERRVHLYDAGTDAAVQRLPGSQGDGYFLATSPVHPTHYEAWDSKQLGLTKQYSVLWSVEELVRLIEVLGMETTISKQDVYDRYAVAGGVPRLILSRDATQLLRTVRSMVARITLDMVRMVIGDGNVNREDLLYTDDSGVPMFALDVKAEGDFDEAKVRYVRRCV